MIKSCLAILPSRDEEQTIARVAETLSVALIDVELSILNSDGSSSDATRLAFDRVQFSARKISIETNTPGKGRQILWALRSQRYEQYDAILLVDTDNRAPLAPIYRGLFSQIVGGADFAVVNYRRHWFEGNLTNHVARPLIFANIGIDVAQPISGEVAISPRLAAFILELIEKVPAFILPGVNGYGIDSFLLLAAKLMGGRISTIDTHATKLHAPSFPHLPLIFRDAVPILCLPIFRQSAVPVQFRFDFELDSSSQSPDINKMVAALRNLGAKEKTALPFPEVLAGVWHRCQTATQALAAADHLWVDYLSWTSRYLEVGLSGGVVAAQEFLSSASELFSRKLASLRKLG